MEYTVRYYNKDTNKMIMEIETKNLLEHLKLVKETDSLTIDDKEGIAICEYIDSNLNIFDGESGINEVLDIYVSVNKK